MDDNARSGARTGASSNARWYAGRVRSWKRAANRWRAALVHLAAISRTVLPYVVQTDFTKTILIVVASTAAGLLYIGFDDESPSLRLND